VAVPRLALHSSHYRKPEPAKSRPLGFEMDLEQDAVENHHESSNSISTASDVPEEALSSPSPADDAAKRAMDHDSLVTVRLSEPPTLHVNTVVSADAIPSRKSLYGNEYTPTDAMAEIVKEEEDISEPEESAKEKPASEHGRSLQDELEANDGDDEAGDIDVNDTPQTPIDPRQSVESEVVNWDKLQQTEDEESKDQDSENASLTRMDFTFAPLISTRLDLTPLKLHFVVLTGLQNTALLLARLEQENNRLATNPKSVKVQVIEKKIQTPQRRPRPPSMAQLRQMVHGPTPPALRYSMLPPPPMTDLEWVTPRKSLAPRGKYADPESLPDFTWPWSRITSKPRRVCQLCCRTRSAREFHLHSVAWYGRACRDPGTVLLRICSTDYPVNPVLMRASSEKTSAAAFPGWKCSWTPKATARECSAGSSNASVSTIPRLDTARAWLSWLDHY
jgi:hypothetical protein